MATGIVSTAALLLGYGALSVALLAVALAAYLTLLLLFLLRLARFPQAFARDLQDPAKAFGFLTFVAGSEVLAARLALSGYVGGALPVAAAGAAAWLAGGYGIPALLILRGTKPAEASSLNGVWFLWVVATQSLVAALSTLATRLPAWLPAVVPLALVLWSFAALLYVLLATGVLGRLFLLPVRAGDLAPPYWILMGATAVSVLAGARLLDASGGRLPAALVDLVGGGSFLLWSFGSWWIPLLLLFGLWRHGPGGLALGYEPGLWSMVFPLGMYATASLALARALGLPFLSAVGKAFFWVALAAWLAVFAGMAASGRRRVAA
ncbi:MAG: tellurite resistance/C4-dicarboxylate transporter family protein [Clostridia bacterium]|nr:tellurite resistance/C4-dicarboxylate transporter family protein [Clostridia bacterium]